MLFETMTLFFVFSLTFICLHRDLNHLNSMKKKKKKHVEEQLVSVADQELA